MSLAGLAHHKLFGKLLPARLREAEPLVPVVRLSGAISPLFGGLTLPAVAGVLDRAFAMESAAAVALVINSPGGAAVQSHLIHTRIRALAAEKKKTVFAFVEDVAASGGYMIACAADEIFAAPASIVGSIGVVSASFGFDKAIERIGVERRLIAAGAFKGMLDPFQPLKPDEVDRLKALQAEVHAEFIALVRARRGGKLPDDDTHLFTGEFWSGTRARGLGLVDGIGDLRAVMRERFGEKVVLRSVSGGRSWFGLRPPGGVGRIADVPGAALALAEERAAWARFGL